MSIGMVYWRGFHRFWKPEETLSVLEIINTGTLDTRLAGLLWLIMEQRASAVVCAAPSFAGKTTLLNVLMDFLPPAVKQVQLNGQFEEFEFLEDARPAETYLVASEFNSYAWYVWGHVARKAFDLLTEGYSLGGTIHARNAKEVAYILYRYLGLPLPLIARLGIIVNLRVIASRDYAAEPVRQVESVSLPVLGKDSLMLKTIALRRPGDNAYEILETDALQADLEAKFGIVKLDLARELSLRQKALEQLREAGRLSRDEVRRAIVEFYQSRTA